MRPSMARDDFEKRDRLIRLMRELALFQAQPRGLTTAQIGEKMGISQRQAQRDIAALESEYKAPFVKQGTRWTLIEGYFLPPVNFTIPEAMAMVVGARLMWRYADRANPFARAAYEKLAAVLPVPMKEPVMEVADGLATKPDDGVWTKVFAALTTAWAERRKVKITYSKDDGTSARVVWPLFLEPTPAAHALYLIAYDEKRRRILNFRTDRITNIAVLDKRFDPPLGSSLRKILGHAWGIWTSDGPPVEVVLRFTPRVASRVADTTWHESQEVNKLSDGRVELHLLIAEPTEIRNWILGWGQECEVIVPESLRDSIASELRDALTAYDKSAGEVRSRRPKGLHVVPERAARSAAG
jgi:predicted DNA-binding transcriptional regulator YafY